MLHQYSTTPFKHNHAQWGVSEYLLNGPHFIKDAGLTKQKNPQLAMDGTQSAKSILLCKERKEAQREFQKAQGDKMSEY